MEKRKYSGIELLRVVSMFFILVLHANMYTFGRPSSYSLSSLLSYFVTSITIIGINCFALITGYFGTRFRVKKIVDLLFQCCFCVLPIALVLYLIGAFKVEGYSDSLRINGYVMIDCLKCGLFQVHDSGNNMIIRDVTCSTVTIETLK